MYAVYMIRGMTECGLWAEAAINYSVKNVPEYMTLCSYWHRKERASLACYIFMKKGEDR